MQAESALEDTAFHEAGHAVLGLLFGIEIVEVSIVPDEQTHSLGKCSWDHELRRGIEPDETAASRRMLEFACAIVATLLAGDLAMRRHNPHRLFSGQETTFLTANGVVVKSDLAHIADWRWIEGLDDIDERIIAKEATTHVRKHWCVIRALATRLLEQRTMMGLEARCLVLEVLGVADPALEATAARNADLLARRVLRIRKRLQKRQRRDREPRDALLADLAIEYAGLDLHR